MCIPGLLFLQNVHTSSFINPKCEVKLRNTTYDHKLYTFSSCVWCASSMFAIIQFD